MGRWLRTSTAQASSLLLVGVLTMSWTSSSDRRRESFDRSVTGASADMKHALMLQAQHKIIPKASHGALKWVTNAAARSSCQPFRLPADCCEPITKHKSPGGCSASPGLKTSDLNK